MFTSVINVDRSIYLSILFYPLSTISIDTKISANLRNVHFWSIDFNVLLGDFIFLLFAFLFYCFFTFHFVGMNKD